LTESRRAPKNIFSDKTLCVLRQAEGTEKEAAGTAQESSRLGAGCSFNGPHTANHGRSTNGPPRSLKNLSSVMMFGGELIVVI
jgi:hypothetical protein